MAEKQLHTPRVKPAPRGSKRGWRVLSSQVPPEVAERFDQLALRQCRFRSDLIRELIEQFVEREAE